MNMDMTETSFLQILSIMGVLFLLMFGLMAFFLKGIYENTGEAVTEGKLNKQLSGNNGLRINALEIDKQEINRSLHDFKNDIGGRVGLLEFKVFDKGN